MKRSQVLMAAVLAAAVMAASVILGACGGGSSTSTVPQANNKVTIKGTLDVGSFTVASKSRFRFALWDFVNPVSLAYAAASGRPVKQIVAVGSDGSYTEGTLALDGSFSVAVAPGASYVVTLLDGVDSAGTIQADSSTGMDTFPVTTSSASTIDLGAVTLPTSTSTAASGTSALVSLGTPSNIANVYGVIDDFMVRLSNVDADANGVVDAKEGNKYNFFVSYHFKYGPSVVTSSTYTYLKSLPSGSFGDPTAIGPSGYQYTLWEQPIGAALVNRLTATWTNALLTMPSLVNGATTTYQCSVNDLPTDPDFPGRFVDFFCSGSANAPTTPPAGDYLITSGSTTLIYLKNVKTQTIDVNLDNLFFPVGRITVNGGAITVWWQWMKKTPGTDPTLSASWVKATDAEIQSVMSIMLWGLFDNGSNNKDYKLDITKASGTYGPITPSFAPSRTGFTWIDKAGFAYALGDY